MKNNKGFTLVELLAVVVILIIVISLITPKVFNQLKTAEKITDQEQINTIIDISKLYMNQHSELLPERNSLYVITLNELKESGLIKAQQILNPSTNEELTGCIIIKFENNKYKYEYNEDKCDKTVTITFDPQGGTLQETSKNVITGEKYGTLPTPTREGYTFMGWNGKNIIDKSKSIKEGIKNETPFNSWASSSFDNNWVVNNLKPNIQYSISYDIEGISVPEYTSEYSGNLGFYLYSLASQPGTYLMSGNGYYISVGEKYHYQLTFTTPSSVNIPESKYVLYTYTNRYLKDGTGVYSTIRLYNLQIEEGNTATPYEPYYITSDTTVVQENNHTLKAIWQAN